MVRLMISFPSSNTLHSFVPADWRPAPKTKMATSAPLSHVPLLGLLFKFQPVAWFFVAELELLVDVLLHHFVERERPE
jgi:hypothetical protein